MSQSPGIYCSRSFRLYILLLYGYSYVYQYSYTLPFMQLFVVFSEDMLVQRSTYQKCNSLNNRLLLNLVRACWEGSAFFAIVSSSSSIIFYIQLHHHASYTSPSLSNLIIILLKEQGGDQRVPHPYWIRLPDQETILSFSSYINLQINE